MKFSNRMRVLILTIAMCVCTTTAQNGSRHTPGMGMGSGMGMGMGMMGGIPQQPQKKDYKIAVCEPISPTDLAIVFDKKQKPTDPVSQAKVLKIIFDFPAGLEWAILGERPTTADDEQLVVINEDFRECFSKLKLTPELEKSIYVLRTEATSNDAPPISAYTCCILLPGSANPDTYIQQLENILRQWQEDNYISYLHIVQKQLESKIDKFRNEIKNNEKSYRQSLINIGTDNPDRTLKEFYSHKLRDIEMEISRLKAKNKVIDELIDKAKKEELASLESWDTLEAMMIQNQVELADLLSQMESILSRKYWLTDAIEQIDRRKKYSNLISEAQKYLRTTKMVMEEESVTKTEFSIQDAVIAPIRWDIPTQDK